MIERKSNFLLKILFEICFPKNIVGIAAKTIIIPDKIICIYFLTSEISPRI